MVPVLEDGDFVLFCRLSPINNPSAGRIVIVRHQRLGTIIKLLGEEVRPGHFRLHGLSPLSTDSNHMGDVGREDMIGCAVLRIGHHGVSSLGME